MRINVLGFETMIRQKRTPALGFFGFILSVGCTYSADAHHHMHEDAFRPPAGSNEMLRAKLSGVDGIEVLISDVLIPAGASVPNHYHPGEEFVYVIEGSAIHRQDGQEDRLYSAGEGLVIPPDTQHAPKGGPNGARAIVFRVHRDGKPERILVPNEVE